MNAKSPESDTQKIIAAAAQRPSEATTEDDSQAPDTKDLLADLEATLDQVADENPRIEASPAEPSGQTGDLQALLEVSLAINSSLLLDEVLEIVMSRAIELMNAERGLIMLLDSDGKLQVRSAHNLEDDALTSNDFRISSSIANKVAASGKSIYSSDAMADERYANQQSVVELHLRSIMCVPLILKEEVVGVIYLDNSSQTRMFLKSDLYVFELYAQMVSNALHNAGMYHSLLGLKQYNESVISTSPVGIVVINADYHLATINAVALEILDIDRNRVFLIGESDSPTSILDLLKPAERADWTHMIQSSLNTGEDFSEPRYFHNTGYAEKALSIKLSPLSTLPGGGDGLIMTIEDMTDKVVMEKYLILSEKLVAKGEMAASIAHELNNYLAIVSNNAELLSSNIEREQYDKARFNSKSITDNIFKIKRFIDNLMDFSRPDTEYISYDIKHLIDDLLFSLKTQPRFRRTHFTIELAPEVPNLEIDVGQIQQVLMNLLNNAADAIEQRVMSLGKDARSFERKIDIVTKWDRPGQMLLIKVSDNGTGMSEDVLRKVFTLHFTTKKSGHGLGLANCRKIAENHSGELTVTSKEGEGSTFTLTLPRFQPKDEK
ncbi:MAG: ATP-binding protein [Candidatus Zixiibacteriota bacterium]